MVAGTRVRIMAVLVVAATVSGSALSWSMDSAAVRSHPLTAGEALWVKRYNGPSNSEDVAKAAAASPDASKVFVTGWSVGGAGSYPHDYATSAYDESTGDQLWTRRYDGPRKAMDEASAMTVSPDGSKVFVTGFSVGTSGSADYATLAYDTSTARTMWTARYDGPSHGGDIATAISTSPDGSTVFVTGYSPRPSGGASTQYATVAYAAATGHRLWATRFDSGSTAFAYGLAVSPDSSRVFVTGWAGGANYDYGTVAYNAHTGAELWVARYDGADDGDDTAQSVAVSPDGNKVFVTGATRTSADDWDYGTVAYQTATGQQLWVATYNGPFNDHDLAVAIAAAPDGSKVFVTGDSVGSPTGSNVYATVAYDTSTGGELWAERYAGPRDGYNQAYGLAVAPDGSQVFVTGYTEGPVLNGSDYATVAYDASSGAQLWASTFNGTASDNDDAYAIVSSPDGSKVFVTGESPGKNSSGDFLTVAYSTT